MATSEDPKEELPFRIVDIPKSSLSERTRGWILIGLLLAGIIVAFWTVGYSYYIAGGRAACNNGEGYLDQDFACRAKPIIDSVGQQITIEGLN